MKLFECEKSETDHYKNNPNHQHDQIGFVARSLLVDLGRIVWIDHDLNRLTDTVGVCNIRLGIFPRIRLAVDIVRDGRNKDARNDILIPADFFLDICDHRGSRSSATLGLD